MSEEQKCVDCGADALGECEACDAAICVDCESGEYEDVYTCADADKCSARITAKQIAAVNPKEELVSTEQTSKGVGALQGKAVEK